MDISEYFKNNREAIISLFGFAMVFMFGFFSGYYYLLDRIGERGVSVEEPSADCEDLFNAGIVQNATAVSGESVKPDSTVTSSQNKVKAYVASKNSKIFHVPSCSSALKIKEENKVWFSSKEEAEGGGFSPHSACIK
ncbi:MAG: Ada metal-binding domain-containing protein [Candidatus Paceibacterota bacterium]|jgi:hypothetical protein